MMSLLWAYRLVMDRFPGSNVSDSRTHDYPLLTDASPRSDHQASRPDRAQSADLEHNLASSVPRSDPRQRLAGLAERQYHFGLRAEFAGIDKGGQLLKPRPAAVGSE